MLLGSEIRGLMIRFSFNFYVDFGEMRIKELEEGGDADDKSVSVFNPKKTVIGVGARFLFYPTLLYNVLRNKIQAEFRWWDEVDQFILLGAVPFPGDVPHLNHLGVGGVVTLNEPYETLVPSSLYHAYGIEHLVLPTRDYLFAPSFGDICRAVEFIHKNASSGKTTYVHCKAGRGRSTTIVICYLVKYRHMTPRVAYEYVKMIRPRVLLASSQWQAVQKYHEIEVKKSTIPINSNNLFASMSLIPTAPLSALEESSFVMISKADLSGYDGHESAWAELSLAYRIQFASQSALTRLTSHWFPCALMADQIRRTGRPCGMGPVAVNL